MLNIDREISKATFKFITIYLYSGKLLWPCLASAGGDEATVRIMYQDTDVGVSWRKLCEVYYACVLYDLPAPLREYAGECVLHLLFANSYTGEGKGKSMPHLQVLGLLMRMFHKLQDILDLDIYSQEDIETKYTTVFKRVQHVQDYRNTVVAVCAAAEVVKHGANLGRLVRSEDYTLAVKILNRYATLNK